MKNFMQPALLTMAAAFCLAAACAAEQEPDRAAQAAPAPEAPARAEAAPAAKQESAVKNVKVTSDRATYLRKDGVLAFEGHVSVDDGDFQMHADSVSLFLEGTNELKRVVAIGNVAVTNELRSGSCAKATYNKALSKVVLYGDESKGISAKLLDAGKRRSEVCGKKITFWIDTEQVEVEGSTVTVDAGGLGGKEGAKKFLGK